MKNLNLNYAYWLCGKFAKKLGFWGLLGGAVAVSSVVFYMMNIVQIEKNINSAQYAFEHTQKNNTNQIGVISQVARPAQTSTEEVAAFYKIFPAGMSLPKWLSLIEKVALKQHLILNRGDYKLTQTKQGQLSSYEIVLPVTGKYTQIRQFIADILHQLPALALSDLQIKRENSLSPVVEARLVFVLYLQGDKW